MNQLVKLSLHIHHYGLGNISVISIFIQKIRIIGTFVPSRQQLCFRAADIGIGRRGNGRPQIEYFAPFCNIMFIPIAVYGIMCIHLPERRIESGDIVLFQPYFKHHITGNKVMAFKLDGYIAEGVLLIIDPSHRPQLIQYLISGIPQVIGSLSSACLHLNDPLIQSE